MAGSGLPKSMQEVEFRVGIVFEAGNFFVYSPLPDQLGELTMPLREIDRQLLERCLRHEPGAWNDFVDRYMGLIYHVIQNVAHARSIVLTPADTEDVAAEIFLAIIDNDYSFLRRFKGMSSLPTYLTVVTRRIAVKECIKRRREAELGHVTAHRASLEDDSEFEAEPIIAADELDRLMDLLPEKEAQVVRLYHLKHLNYRQIGKQLGIPENSVGPILSKARQKLRRSADQKTAASS